jgi:hypothetical protein
MLPSVIALVKTAPVPWRIVRRENMTFSLYRALLTGTRLWLRVSRSPDQLGSAFLVSSRDRLRFGSGSNSWRCNIRFISLRRKAANQCPDPIAVFCPKPGKTFHSTKTTSWMPSCVQVAAIDVPKQKAGAALDATACFPQDAAGLSNILFILWAKQRYFEQLMFCSAAEAFPCCLQHI